MANKTFTTRDSELRADFWISYQKIYTADNKFVNFVKCRFCNQVDGYDSTKGLKKLKRHYKICHSKLNSAIDIFVKKKIVLTESNKQSIVEALVKFCYKDLRPFASINGNGFADILVAVINAFTKSGKVDEDDIRGFLPCANTVCYYLNLYTNKYLHFFD